METKYKKLKIKLGEGAYKTVYKAIDEEEGKEVAYNEIKMHTYEEETQSIGSFSKEIALLKNIDHPYIIKIFDYWFQDDSFIFITELMTGGTVRDYISRMGPLNLRLMRKWAKQILEGLQHLHSLEPPVVHRDIKNENIFVSSQGDIKIGDLGIAREKKHKRYTIIGTPNFMAREMFEGEGYTEKVDVYAFGMCLIEMATGLPPYNEMKDNSEVYKSILQGVLPNAIHAIKDNCLKSLIMGCLVSQKNRYTAAMCLDHHFFHPNVECQGDCIPKVCSAIYPLASSSKDIELSLISYVDETITFQILLKDSGRFIKFDYDLNKDTPEGVFDELCSEKILTPETAELFLDLLNSGVKVAQSKNKSGKLVDGIIELDSGEIVKMDESVCLNNKNNIPIKDEDSGSESERIELGQKTLEVMKEIDEEMKALEKKRLAEKRREEQTHQRLKAKLEGKNIQEDLKKMTIENVYDQFPSSENSGSAHLCRSENLEKNELELSELEINDKKSTENVKSHENNFNAQNGNLVYASGECIKNITEEGSPKTKSFNGTPQSGVSSQSANTVQSSTNTVQSSVNSVQTPVYNTVQSANSTMQTPAYSTAAQSYNNTAQPSANTTMSSANSTLTSTNNTITSTNTNITSANNTSTNVSSANTTISNIHPNSPTLNVNTNSREGFISSPPISSPPFCSAKLMEEQVVNDMSLNESYDIARTKYRSNYSVSQFALDAASITGRTEDTANSWIKALKDEDLETVFDLKLIVYEDWEKLPLTVFSSRAMQNMLYGIGNIPLKEKQLPMNPKLKDYENKLSIKEFLEDLCTSINRPELAAHWENQLMAQDLRTVAELKSLHQDDWNRLGLSVFGYRILKNVIFRKGKIMLE